MNSWSDSSAEATTLSSFSRRNDSQCLLEFQCSEGADHWQEHCSNSSRKSLDLFFDNRFRAVFVLGAAFAFAPSRLGLILVVKQRQSDEHQPVPPSRTDHLDLVSTRF